jgi:hypothetical protein
MPDNFCRVRPGCNCLSRKRKTYNPVIFRCYQPYAAKDIKEKGIGKATNILKHPIFYAIPVVFIIMVVMLFRSGLAHGDMFGAKKHQKDGMQAFQKAATGGVQVGAPVDLNKGEGFYKDGKWVGAPVPAEAKKAPGGVVAPSEPPSGGGAAPVPAKGAYVYQPPAKVIQDGDTWTFIEQGSGRTIGFVKWVEK